LWLPGLLQKTCGLFQRHRLVCEEDLVQFDQIPLGTRRVLVQSSAGGGHVSREERRDQTGHHVAVEEGSLEVPVAQQCGRQVVPAS